MRYGFLHEYGILHEDGILHEYGTPPGFLGEKGPKRNIAGVPMTS